MASGLQSRQLVHDELVDLVKALDIKTVELMNDDGQDSALRFNFIKGLKRAQSFLQYGIAAGFDPKDLPRVKELGQNPAQFFAGAHVFSPKEMMCEESRESPFFAMRAMLQGVMMSAQDNVLAKKRKVARLIVQDPGYNLAVLIEMHTFRNAACLIQPDEDALDKSPISKPVVEVLFTVGSRETLSTPDGAKQMRVVQEWISSGTTMSYDMTSMNEVLMVKEVLEYNATLLSEEYQLKMQANGSGARGQHGAGLFKASFLTPLRPIPPDKRNPSALCGAGCGKAGTKMCSLCEQVKYCSADCQKQDWKTHKTVCKKKSGAANAAAGDRSVVIDLNQDANAGMYMTPVSLQAGATRSTKINKDRVGDKLPPNTKGARKFVIKVQAPLVPGMRAGPPLPMLIYDQRRAFTISLGPNQVEAHQALMQAVRLTTLTVPKVYLWAQRDSDKDLRVFLDDLPDQNATW